MYRKVLIADESVKDSKVLRDALEQNEFNVDLVKNAEVVEKKMREENYDLLILETVLSKIDGVDICKEIRSFSECPIMVISSNDNVDNKVSALDSGADDYMVKPFNKKEFRARVDAIMRRRTVGGNNKNFLEKAVIEVEDLKINTLGRVVNIGDKVINLTAKEFDLLILLATNRGEVFSREVLLDKIWGYDEYFADVRTVDVHIRRLRKKIERDPSKPFYVITRWGQGYYFREE